MNREPEEANAHNMVARCCQYAPKRMKCASRCVDEVACSKSFGGHPAKHSSPETRDLYMFQIFHSNRYSEYSEYGGQGWGARTTCHVYSNGAHCRLASVSFERNVLKTCPFFQSIWKDLQEQAYHQGVWPSFSSTPSLAPARSQRFCWFWSEIPVQNHIRHW